MLGFLTLLAAGLLCASPVNRGSVDDGLTAEARSRLIFAALGRSRRWGDEPFLCAGSR